MTDQEKQYGNELIKFYSTPVYKDQEMIDNFVYADESGKQSMIADFLDNIISPQNEQELNIYQAKVDELSQKISLTTNYSNGIRNIKTDDNSKVGV